MWRDPATGTAYRKAYYEAHKPEILAQQREYVAGVLAGPDAEKYRDDMRQRVKKWKKSPKGMANNRRYMRERIRALRAEFLEVFGHRCACCGETDEVFLTIDHINGGGKAPRKAPGGAQHSMLYSIKKMGWPRDKFRLFCMNCNWATRKGDPCPHVVRQADEMLAGVLCA